MARTFFIRLNLDDMCADLDTIRHDQHADWLAGFRAGCRGRVPEGWDGALLMGAKFGLSCWEEAEGYRSRQSDKGKLSAASRKAKVGTADPRANCEPIVNHGSTTVLTGCEPDVNPSNIQHPTSSIEHPNIQYPSAESKPPRKKRSPPDPEITKAVMCMCGNINEKKMAIRLAIEKYGRDAVLSKDLIGVWPNKLDSLMAGTSNTTCPHPDGSPEYWDWHVFHGKVGK